MVRIYGTHILMSTIVTGGVISYNMDEYSVIFLTRFAFNAIRIFRFVNIKLNIINTSFISFSTFKIFVYEYVPSSV